MGNNITEKKSKAFALRIIKLYQFLTETKHEFVMSKQMLRSGTSIGANAREASIGANAREAERGQSKADFYAKFNIALKEADETAYWLELLHESNYLDKTQFMSIYADCEELIRLLVAITKTQKRVRSAEW